MIPIENKIDWNAIRAEYIGGGISQRKLAQKYGIAEGTMLDRANKEGWQSLRKQATSKAIIKAEQKAAENAANNATIAADLKRRLLLRLSRIEEKFPFDATEIVMKDEKGKLVKFTIKQLTAAFKDITDDMPRMETQADGIFDNIRTIADLINNPLPDIEPNEGVDE